MRVRVLILLLALLIGNTATAAKVGPSPWPQTRELPAGEGPWVVRARFTSDQSLTRLLERAAPWRVDRDAGQLIIEVNSRAEYQQLLDEGFAVAVDPELTAEAFGPVPETPDQTESISGYPCYRTVEESLASAQALVAQHGAIAELVDIGDSWKKQQNAAQGYDLWVLRLTNRSIPGIKPVHYLQGGLHAREYVTSETVLRSTMSIRM